MLAFFFIVFGVISKDQLIQSPTDQHIFKHPNGMVAYADNDEKAAENMTILNKLKDLPSQISQKQMRENIAKCSQNFGNYDVVNYAIHDGKIRVDYKQKGQSSVFVQAYLAGITALGQVTKKILEHFHQLVTSIKNPEDKLWHRLPHVNKPLETDIHIPQSDPVLKQKALDNMPQNIPADQRDALAETAAHFISKATDVMQIEKLLSALGELSADQREKLVLLTTNPATSTIFTEEFMSRSDDIISAIRHVPKANLQSAFETAAHFISKETDAEQISKLLSTLGAMPAKKRQNLVMLRTNPATNKVFTEAFMSKSGDIISAIFYNTANELQSVFETAAHFISAVTDGTQIAKLLSALDQLSADQRENLVLLITHPSTNKVFTKHFMGCSDYIISVIQYIPANELQPIFETAGHFISEQTPGNEISGCLSGLRIMSAEQRQNLVLLTTNPATSKMFKEVLMPWFCDIISAIWYTPVNELQSVFETAAHFISAVTGVQQIRKLLSALGALSAEQRQNLVLLTTNPATSTIFTEEFMSRSGDIISAIQQAPEANLQSVFETAAHFISEKTSVSQIEKLLSGLCAMSAEQRQKLVDLTADPKTKTVFTKKFKEHSEEAISAIKNIPAANLQSVFETAAHFISEETTLETIKIFIFYIGRIPPNQHSNTVLAIQGQNWSNTLLDYRKSQLIEKIADIQNDNRVAVVDRAIRQFNTELNNLPTPHEKFDRMVRLLQTRLDRPFPDLHISNGNDVYTGQEALVREEQQMRTAYEQIFNDPSAANLIIDNLPDEGAVESQFTAAAQALHAWIKKRLPMATTPVRHLPTKQFRLYNANRTLLLLEGDPNIEHHPSSSLGSYQTYSSPGLPNIKQLFVLAYRLIQNKHQENLIFNAQQIISDRLFDQWANLRAKYPVYYFLQDEYATAIQSQDGQKILNHIAGLVQNIDNELVMPNLPAGMPMGFLGDVMRDILAPDFTPLIEALAMVMRGHNVRLDNPKDHNDPACAQGAYLQLLKIIPEILQLHDIQEKMAAIKIEACT